MLIRTTKFAALMLLVGIFALAALGQSPASAGLVPGVLGNPPSVAFDSSAAITGTVTITPTATVTPTATAVPPTATSTKVASTPTVTPTKALPTATKTVTPTVAVATATKTATPVPATATKTATKAATPVARLGPRAAAGVVSSLSTGFLVQNMDSTITATVTAQFYDTAGNIVNSVTRSPGPGQSASIDQRIPGGGLDCGVLCNSPWNGSVVLSSNTQIASIVNEVSGSSATLLTDYRADSYNGIGATNSDMTVLLPQLTKGVVDVIQNKIYNSTIAVQNTNISASANITITYYNVSFGGVPQASLDRKYFNIPAGSSKFVDLQTETFDAWNGSAKVTSDQNVAVIVNQNAAGALSIYPGLTSANASNSAPYTLYVPQMLKNVADTSQGLTWGSGMLVMTLDQTPAQVYVTYKNVATGHVGEVYTDSKLASPGAAFDQRYDTALSGVNVLFGSATITSTKPIVAIVNLVTNYDPLRGSRAETYRAVPGGVGTAKVFVPLLLKNIYDTGQAITWGTAVAGQYMGTDPSATITITYFNMYNNLNRTTVSQTTVSPSNPFFAFDQRYDPNVIDANFFGSAVITASNNMPITAIVNQVGGNGDRGDAASSYAGINQ